MVTDIFCQHLYLHVGFEIMPENSARVSSSVRGNTEQHIDRAPCSAQIHAGGLHRTGIEVEKNPILHFL